MSPMKRKRWQTSSVRTDQADGEGEAGVVFGEDAADVEEDFVVLNPDEDSDAAGAKSDGQVVGGELRMFHRDDDGWQLNGGQ